MHYPLVAPPQSPMDFAFFTAFRDLLEEHRELVARVELLEDALLADEDDDEDDDDGED